MKFSRTFKGFFRLKNVQNFTNFNKNSKQISKKYYIYFPQVLTHKNITKMSRKVSRTYGKFLGIFYKSFR
jgi:hypothetical protein